MLSEEQKIVAQFTDFFSPDTVDYYLHEPSFQGNEWNYVKECLDTGWVSSVGSYVDQFEVELAKYTGVKYAIVTTNGTAALHIAMILAGVKAGDEVLLPSLTFIATANAVMYVNATPHFVDVDTTTMGVDPMKLRDYLNKNTLNRAGVTYNKHTKKAIKALCIMHTLGHPVHLDELQKICSEFNIELIEDAAEALGSYYKGAHVGQHGKISTLSFNGNKIITCGGGGAILTSDAELAKAAKHLTTTAKTPHPWKFNHDAVGYNYRLPNINAALGCAQMELLPTFLKNKREMATKYEAFFNNIDALSFMKEPTNTKSNYWLNACRINSTELSIDSLIDTLTATGIHVRPLWQPMHTLPMYKDFPRMELTNSETLANEIICLPSSVELINTLIT